MKEIGEYSEVRKQANRKTNESKWNKTTNSNTNNDDKQGKGITIVLQLFSRVLRDSTTRFAGPSVGWSVGQLAVLSISGSQLPPNCHYESF